MTFRHNNKTLVKYLCYFSQGTVVIATGLLSYTLSTAPSIFNNHESSSGSLQLAVFLVYWIWFVVLGKFLWSSLYSQRQIEEESFDEEWFLEKTYEDAIDYDSFDIESLIKESRMK
ncbi:hypothetical protein CJU90_3285 [Yarrowia sp. C11]|nr:hypothetical protein CKK34_4732 [Yarrowia sp. E02]KAG5369762.1 hypothetical protein CJU90_3285 [Yarrowia sp. C11]